MGQHKSNCFISRPGTDTMLDTILGKLDRLKKENSRFLTCFRAGPIQWLPLV